MNKVVATDMDGTLLDGHHSYDRKRLRDLLEEFNKKNYLFAVATTLFIFHLKTFTCSYCIKKTGFFPQFFRYILLLLRINK